jgi:hypothetical protein
MRNQYRLYILLIDSPTSLSVTGVLTYLVWSNENDVTKKWVMGGRMEKKFESVKEICVFENIF